MSVIATYISNDYPTSINSTAFPGGLVDCGRLAQRVVYQLSAAELKSFQTTAIQLAPAPGAGFALLPRRMTLQYKFLTTAFTLGNADNKLTIEYTGKAVALIQAAAAGLVDQVVNEVLSAAQAVAGVLLAQTNVENLGLEVKLTGTTPALTLGLGSVILTLDYEVLKLV